MNTIDVMQETRHFNFNWNAILLAKYVHNMDGAVNYVSSAYYYYPCRFVTITNC